MNRSTKVSLSVVAAAGVFVAGSATGAVAGKLVTGNQIAKHTVTSRNIAPESVGVYKLKPSLRAAIAAGDQGPAGAKGDKGDKGETGPAGPTGPAGAPAVNDVSLAITDDTTPDAVPINGHWLVPLPGDPLNGDSDSDVDLLTIDLTDGRYVVDVTAQFYSVNPTPAENYGIVTLYSGSDSGSATNLPGTVFTADLPDSTDAANAGQTNGSQIIEVTEPTTIYVRGSVRTDATSQIAVAGAQAVITKIS